MSVSEWLDDAKELFKQGVEKSLKGEHTEAIQAFDQVLQLHPTDADTYGHRCVVCHRVGNRQGAIADCQQAATLYLEQGKTKEHQYALKMLQKLRA